MNTKEIKVGDKVLVEAEVNNIYNDGDIGCFTQYTAHDGGIDEARFDVLCSLVHKMTDSTTPKYDPCRKFRAGDIVEPCSVKGRWLSEAWKNRKGIHYEVTSDEDDDCVMWVQDADSLHPKDVEAVFFQLVTPVEEREPYFVSTNKDCSTCTIFKKVGEKKLVHSAYYFMHGNGCTNAIMSMREAQKAAEAERDRLNAEYRKEQDNG